MRRLIKNGRFWIGLAACVLVVLLSLNRVGHRLEALAFDQFTRWSADASQWSKEIVIVLIDEPSIEKFSEQLGRWPWSRRAYCAVLAYLKHAGAHAVAFDLLLSEKSDAEQDDRLASYLAATGNASLAALQRPKELLQQPVESFRNAVHSRLGLVNTDKDPGGTIRWYSLQQSQAYPPLALTLTEKGKLNLPTADRVLIRWSATMPELISQGHAYSAGPVVANGMRIMEAIYKEQGEGEFDPKLVKEFISRLPPDEEARRIFGGKLVFLGCSGTATHDSKATPLEGDTPGVIVHATALNNFMRGDWLTPVSSKLVLLLNLLMALAVPLLCAFESRLRLQILSVATLVIGLGVFSYFLFCKGFWLPPLTGMMVAAVSFSAITTHNYFVEGKQRRYLKQLFSDFVSPDVLAELQQSGGGLNLKGDRRSGTVLFCDLAGFTTFTESAPPEQLFEAINSYLSEASQCLLVHEAYIDKFIGDAVMAIFGILKPMPDHAARACFAALDLQKMMKLLNERLAQKYDGLNLGLRTGVNSGPMIAGEMGFLRKRNYTVLGDTVNLASRLEGANKTFHSLTMIGPKTYEEAREQIEVRRLDLLRVKGKKLAVPVYELLARKGELTPTQRELCLRYEEGIDHYRAQQWEKAIAAFKAALEIDSSDGPSETYLKRCIHLKAHPPEDGWDGSYTLDSK